MALTTDQKSILLQDVKNHLRITWDEEDNNLMSMIDRAISYLKSKTGTDMDYSVEGQPKHLLLERCRYVYNRSSEEFEQNFKHEIIGLQFEEAVKERRERRATES